MLNKVVSRLTLIRLNHRVIPLYVLSALVLIVPLLACSIPLQTSSTIKVASSTPIELQASGLVIDPVVVEPSEGILITAQIINADDATRDYRAQLLINDIIEDEKIVTIPAGETYTLQFTEAKMIPGTYSVNLGNLTGQFIVVESTEAVTQSGAEIIEADPVTPSCCGGSSTPTETDLDASNGCGCSGNTSNFKPTTSTGCGCSGNPDNTESQSDASSDCGCSGSPITSEADSSSGCGCGRSYINTEPEPYTSSGCGCGS